MSASERGVRLYRRQRGARITALLLVGGTALLLAGPPAHDARTLLAATMWAAGCAPRVHQLLARAVHRGRDGG